MEFRTLGKTGLRVSALGFGASSLGGAFGPIDESAGIRTVHAALDGGINFIDVAPFYGLTAAERVLGQALRGVPRDRYLLATKVGRYGGELKDFDFSAKRVISSVDESLARLGVDYVDLIQAHDVEFGDLEQIVNETVPAMRTVQKAGKARFVGVTGLPVHLLGAIADRVAVDTVLSYCHYTLNDTALRMLTPRLKRAGIGILNAAPLAMGLLSSGGRPWWHPAPKPLQAACAAAAKRCTERGIPIEELAVAFAVANTDVACTIVGTADPAIIAANIAAAQAPPDPQLLSEVLEILRPFHNLTWPSGRPENFPPTLQPGDTEVIP